MPSTPHVKHPIASAVSLVLGTAATLPVYAQDEPQGESRAGAEQVIEEVVVTGIRSSLRRSMEVKRDSYGVVDAITAEDIGKFPDTNLAESLQRITGVAIDRQRGEGAEVTVRGFGGGFNLITLNGRQMPTHNGTGRSFDFADIASDAVSGVQVYKTGRASVPTGGIGATINVTTQRPLDQPGLNLSFGGKAIHDTSVYDGDEFTPEVSGLVSHTFFDDTVGILVNGNYSERHSGQAFGSNSAWIERDGAAIPDNGQQTNPPAEGDIVGLPQQMIYQTDEFDRSRINGQVALQWRPVESLTATLDYTYAEFELDHRFNNMSVWFSPTGQSGAWTAEGPVVSPMLYSESNNQPDLPMGAGIDASRNERESIGVNLEWDPRHNLTLKLDYHDSTAERSPNSPYGSNAVITIASFERQSASVDYSRDLPVTSIVTNDPLSPDDMQVTGSVFTNNWATMDIEQMQFSGQFRFNEERSAIDFGVALTELDNFESSSNVQRNTWGQNQASAYGTIADLLTPASLRDVYDEIDGGDGAVNNYFLFDMAEVAARAEYLQSLPSSNPLHLRAAPDALGDCGTGFCADSNPGFGNQLSEETISYFIEFTHMGELGAMPYNLRVGLRHEQTDVTASAESETYSAIVWAAPNEFTAVVDSDTTASGLEDDYDATLPMFNLDLELTEEITLRAAYSKTIARSSFQDLRGTLDTPDILRVDRGIHTANATLGNPGLQPHESDNIDLSVEWYYGDASYVSAGWFDKSVDNFVTDTEVEDLILFENLAHPALGPLYTAAVDALGPTAGNADLWRYILDTFPNEPGVDAVAQTITGVPGRDAPAFYDVDSKINSEDQANINGWELTWQHEFGDTGFGFIANATFVDGDAEFDNNSMQPQFALPGLSDTRNLIVYYDKHGLQVRIAYNWRDAFFTGGTTQPSYTETYEQWDINASYEVIDGLTVFVEAINVTDEINRTHARSSYQIYYVGQTGPRYQGGFRYNF